MEAQRFFVFCQWPGPLVFTKEADHPQLKKAMPKTILRCYLTLLCLLLPLGLQAATVPSLPGKPDVRLIIDISGSMKQNDPHNLRQPAVRMVSRLLPDGSRAGVWTFGHEVNMLVPFGVVDKAWRQQAIRRSRKINSVGLYTNIGKALQVASDDFYRGHRFDHTHFILLTDGMVDLPGGPEKDAAERHRILTRVLRRIQSHGAHIDTIALSPDADKGLLKRLAVATGGIFTVANNADQLSQAFLRALDNASPSEQVPISHNQFQVDKSIRELTALVFHKTGSQKTQLVRPDGVKIGADSTGSQVHWLHEKAYDLVTIEKPMPGQWHIDAQLKPNSRVTVVSNFRMAVSDLPANFYPDDRLDLGVAFYDDKSQITNKDLLRLISVSVTISDNHGRSGTKIISDPDHVPDNGVYHEPITRLDEPGSYQVKVRADGKTFQRQQTQTITLRPPVDVEVQALGTAADSRYKVTVTPQDPRLAVGKTQVELRYQTPDGQASVQPLSFDPRQGQWQKILKATDGPGDYKVALRVKGMTDSGQTLQFSPEGFTATFPRKAKQHLFVDLAAAARKTSTPAPKPVTSSPKVRPITPTAQPQPAPASTPKAAPAKVPEKVPAAKPSPAPAKVVPKKSGHWMRWAVFLLIILLLAGAAAGGFFFWRRRRGKTPPAEPTVPEAPKQEAPAHEPVEEASVSEDEEEPALDPMDDVAPELETGSGESETPVEEEAGTMAGIDETLTEAPEDASEEDEEAIPVMEESVPEPETEPEPAAEAEPEVSETEPAEEDTGTTEPESVVEESAGEEWDAEALADQIMQENNQQEDDDYSLEDFDIGEIDDLADESQGNPDKKDAGNGKDDTDDKGKT